MKTAVSIADDVFLKAEKYAKRKKISRSSLYTRAIEEYLQNDDSRKLIERINKVCEEVDTTVDPFWKEAQGRVLKNNEW